MTTRIYTYGGRPAERNITIAELQAAKGSGTTYTQATVLDVEEAAACVAADVDILSVVDIDVPTIRAAAPDRMIIAAQAWPQYGTTDEILAAAVAALDAGADAVFTSRGLDVVERLAAEGIAVQGHVGLIPRRSVVTGGLRPMGKTADEALRIAQDLRRLEDAGATFVEVECVTLEAMQVLNPRTGLITIGIGTPACDVNLQYMEDITGDTADPPRHARAFGDLATKRTELQTERISALQAWKAAVADGSYPGPGDWSRMPDDERAAFEAALDG